MKKGFTLIEMLGIIAVLAVVLLVTFPVLNNTLKKMKENTTNNFTNNLKISAEAYIELNRDKYENIDVPGTEISFTVQDLYDAELLKGKNENINTSDTIKAIVGQDLIIRYYFNGEQIGIEKQIDDNLTREIALIKENLNQSTPDGIYYYTEQGNLENNPAQINLTRNWGKPYGNILIHNHQFISGCIQMNNKNYDYYKGQIEEQAYPCSTIRGENLVINGDLSYKNNTNFSSWTYVSEEGTNGYLSKTVSSTLTKYTDYYIPVDATKKYEIGFTAKTNNPTATHYVGFVTYNENKEGIKSAEVMYFNNTLTTLARDLNNGDEYIYLTDLTQWVKNASQTYYRGFIFWNYKDSTGYQYPELTYSKIFWNNLYENSNIDLDNNRIKLNSPWNNGYISSGTKLSQTSAGPTYNFALRSNQTLTENYETYSAIIEGTNTANTRAAKKFDPGTKYIKFFIWQNNNNIANTTVDFKDIYIREVTE